MTIARERNVVATDEFLLSPEPYPTREAWCRDRLASTRARLEQLDWMTPTVLVNHFPLVREPCDALFYPEFSLWCGTTKTADWHTRYNAVCSVYGHLHIPRTTWYDDVRFEEVSVGYPREWRRRKPYSWLRQVLPDPAVRARLSQRLRRSLRDHSRDAANRPRSSGNEFGSGSHDDGGRAGVVGAARTRHPEDLAYSELYSDPPGLTPLPEEEPLIARSVAKRRNEFITVRHCARIALGELGVPPVPILKGDKGEPCWPDGVVGSLTHCTGYRGAVVGRSAAVRSVGIDAEPHDVLPRRRAGRDQPSRGTPRNRRVTRRACIGTESCSAPRKQRTRPGFR